MNCVWWTVVAYFSFSLLENEKPNKKNNQINQTKLSFLDEKIRNESSRRGSTNSVASRFLNFSGPTAAAIFLTAARHATSTPSLPTRADSFLHNSTSRTRPSSRTTSSASRLSLHNLEQTNPQIGTQKYLETQFPIWVFNFGPLWAFRAVRNTNL